jgi:SAM-dependent methyltransferase
MAAATAIGSSGRVVATDISSEMLAVSVRRAHQAGVDNIEFVEADAEKLGFDTDSFDAVTNTYGLMFCPDLERAVQEMHRVLRPGGRAAIVVWDEPRNNPFFEVMFTAAAPLLALTPPEPGGPGPFRLASSERLATLLRAAAFLDVVIGSLPMTFESGSVDDYIQMFDDLALKAQMARLADADRIRLQAAVADVARPHVDDRARLRLQTTSLCATARK